MKCILSVPNTLFVGAFLNMVKLVMLTSKQIQGLLNSQPFWTYCCVIWSCCIENSFLFTIPTMLPHWGVSRNVNFVYFRKHHAFVGKFHGQYYWKGKVLCKSEICVCEKMFNLWDVDALLLSSCHLSLPTLNFNLESVPCVQTF